MKKTIYFLMLAVVCASCGKNDNLLVQDEPNTAADLIHAESAFINGIPTEKDYSRTLPSYLNVLGMNIVQANSQKAGLGRVLFYDKNLSKDRMISCASCHKQAKAFSDDVAFSLGVDGNRTSRNSMPLANVASFSAHYSNIGGKTPFLFWDERAPDVASQSRQTFANPLEMGMDMSEVISRVKEQDYYPYLWKQVFGNFEPTEAQVLECLQEFVGAMGCGNSRLDISLEQALDMLNVPTSVQKDTVVTVTALYYGNNDTTINTVIVGLPGLSLSENRGRDIFVANCSKCHSPVRPFQEVFAACNGLDMEYPDQGLAKLTGNPADVGVFKSPSLRNIALTAPYMHDGRFKTLQEVVNFYSEQVKPHPNLHPKMLHNGDQNLHLTAQEKQDLIAFLRTFTDVEIGVDSRFSNPFRQ